MSTAATMPRRLLSRCGDARMLLDILLSLGLLLTTASQLRAFGPAVGPGELLLLVWIIPNLFREASRLGPALTPPLTRFLTFWIVLALALGIGTIVGFGMEQTRDINGYKHDSVAYALTAIVSCLLVVEPQCKRLHRVAWLLVALGSIAILVQLVAAQAGLTLPFIDPWFWDRFRGWSDDPNVFALLCAVVLFLAIYLAETAAFGREKTLAIACCLPPLYAGLLSHSDSFVVALVFGGTTMLALWPANWLARSDRNTTWRFFTIGAVALCLLVLEIATGWISKGFFAVAYDDSDQVWIRLALWREAIKGGLDSYLLGFGPGPHLQPPYVQLRGTTVREAHNVILHVLTQGGIIAVASCVWIMTICWVAVYRQRLVALTALLSALAAFSLFHFLIRHPLFWFAIALTLVAGTQARYAPAYFRQRVFAQVAARLKKQTTSPPASEADRIFPALGPFARPAMAAGCMAGGGEWIGRRRASPPW